MEGSHVTGSCRLHYADGVRIGFKEVALIKVRLAHRLAWVFLHGRMMLFKKDLTSILWQESLRPRVRT